MILTTEKIESIERCYFSPSYNLTKDNLKVQLADHIQMLEDLNNRLIKPFKVVGGGYKNGRLVAERWLEMQILTNKHLLKYYDLKNKTK